MRILEIETFGRGGLIHYAFNLSCALADRGHEVTLVTAASFELAAQPRPPGLEVVPMIGHADPRRRRTWPTLAASAARKAEALGDARRVVASARRLRPDLIHLHCTNPIALVYLTLLERLAIPTVVTAHVVTAHERTRWQDAVSRLIHRRGALIIAHSETDRSRLLDEFGVAAGRVIVIPHGEYGFLARDAAPPDRGAARSSLGLEPHHEVVLFFGYIREYKGLDVLLDSWPAVARARLDARLVIAGDPVRLDRARRQALEAQAARLGAIHRFEYIPVNDVHRYFAAADVLVMPYRHVSQSGVLFLALAEGVPVVATRVGGLPEVLNDGDNALLVPPESADDLTAALIRLLGDPALRRTLVDGGRRVAKAHSWASIAERTETAFARLVDGHPTSLTAT
jgi:glycosyltransferase involved in cell wall biosynthesis